MYHCLPVRSDCWWCAWVRLPASRDHVTRRCHDNRPMTSRRWCPKLVLVRWVTWRSWRRAREISDWKWSLTTRNRDDSTTCWRSVTTTSTRPCVTWPRRQRSSPTARWRPERRSMTSLPVSWPPAGSNFRRRRRHVTRFRFRPVTSRSTVQLWRHTFTVITMT